jgi:hypothetical protein
MYLNCVYTVLKKQDLVNQLNCVVLLALSSCCYLKCDSERAHVTGATDMQVICIVSRSERYLHTACVVRAKGQVLRRGACGVGITNAARRCLQELFT